MQAEALIKLICGNNGDMDYDLISDFICPDDFDEDDVSSLITEHESLVTVTVNGQRRVVAQSKLKLCRSTNCSSCNNIHLCKFYLLGDCPYTTGRRRRCRYSHNLHTDQNVQVLHNYGLNHLTRHELCILLLQNDRTLLPEVCFSYNGGTGEYGRCKDGASCKRLHICQRYLRDSCEGACSRTHDFYDAQPLKSLQDRGVPAQLMPFLKNVYSNIEALRKKGKGRTPQHHAKGNAERWSSDEEPPAAANTFRPAHSTAEKREICMYFVKGSCKHGDRCFREHTKLPYKWEVKHGGSWVALSNNEIVEKDYCNPANICSNGICFDTMTSCMGPVRRLSTVSSVEQPTFILTTTWAWYWQDEYSNWIQYASANGGYNTASITSEELEQKYLQDDSAEIDFTAGSQSYTLSFRDMIQTNKRYGTKKSVRRRPVFVSSADAQAARTNRPASNNQMKMLPSNWNKALAPEVGYKKVALLSDSTEYQQIQTLFNNTMRGYDIQKIERIQNKSLWEVFQWQKEQMKKNNSGRNVAERQLFHGTDDDHIEAICKQNFDWRICGTHGTIYGKGSYFARDAKYSDEYTGKATKRSMFVCRVLVGDYTRGDSSYMRPPSKDGGDSYFYDSCVDNVHNPSIFVVFEKHQIYPEYLITYSENTWASPPPQRVTPVAARQTTYTTPVHNPMPVPKPRPTPVTYSTPSYTYKPPPPPKSDNSCVIC